MTEFEDVIKCKFEDVIKCKDVKELNDFITEYLEQYNLKGIEANKTMWALFYKYGESCK